MRQGCPSRRARTRFARLLRSEPASVVLAALALLRRRRSRTGDRTMGIVVPPSGARPLRYSLVSRETTERLPRRPLRASVPRVSGPCPAPLCTSNLNVTRLTQS